MTRTLVLGAAVGYSAAQIVPFLTSLRRAGYRGDVALLVDRARLREFRRLPLFAGVTLLPASQWLPFRYAIFKSPRVQRFVWHPLQALLWLIVRALGRLPLAELPRLRAQVALGQFLYPPTETRFLRYWRLLEGQPYDRVLLSDVRDVLFQQDPFAQLPERGLAVSMEVGDYTIGTQRWNARMTLQLYGAAMLERIGSQPVSCSGVTYGDGAAMREYLRLMVGEILALSRRNARQGWFDQALHNVVLWQRWQGPVQKLETLGSAVATLGAVPEQQLRLDDSGCVRNRDGTLPGVLHQYDRLTKLAPALVRALAPGASALP